MLSLPFSHRFFLRSVLLSIQYRSPKNNAVESYSHHFNFVVVVLVVECMPNDHHINNIVSVCFSFLNKKEKQTEIFCMVNMNVSDCY